VADPLDAAVVADPADAPVVALDDAFEDEPHAARRALTPPNAASDAPPESSDRLDKVRSAHAADRADSEAADTGAISSSGATGFAPAGRSIP
jgi:hypothetical protein